MTTKQSQQTQTTRHRYGILRVLAYWAIVFCGLALLLGVILRKIDSDLGVIVRALNLVASLLAYGVVACYSFGYARRRGVWWLVAWVVAVVLIVLSLVFGLF